MKITVNEISLIVGATLGYSQDELKGPRRKKELVHARHIVCWLARERTGLSFPQIGIKMGRRDHTTILHAARRIDMMPGDATLAQCVAAVDDYARQRALAGGSDSHALAAARRIREAGARVVVYTADDVAAMAALLCTLAAGPERYATLENAEPDPAPPVPPGMVEQIVVEMPAPALMQAARAAVAAWDKFDSSQFTRDEQSASKRLGTAIDALREAAGVPRASFKSAFARTGEKHDQTRASA